MSQNLDIKRRGFPGTPVEWQKASLLAGKKFVPRLTIICQKVKPAVTLSFGDVMQLERLTMVTLMAFKLPLKMWKLKRLNNSQRSICEPCHTASRSHHSAWSFARGRKLKLMGGIAWWRLGSRREVTPQWDIHQLERVACSLERKQWSNNVFLAP